MRIDVITLFPGMFPGPLGDGIVGRALERDLLRLRVLDLREFADPPHRKADDEPFGGGAGMVLKPEPLFRAVDGVRDDLAAAGVDAGPVVLLSPQGRRLEHETVRELGEHGQLTLICGRYEGVDERVRQELVDVELSIGDYVLTGGELAAMVVVEAVARFLPEALGDPASARQDSFYRGILDHPHYTRPAEYRGLRVPEVLRSGNHEAIRRWRRREALRNTLRKRPDLLREVELTPEDDELLAELQGAGDRSDGRAALQSPAGSPETTATESRPTGDGSE